MSDSETAQERNIVDKPCYDIDMMKYRRRIRGLADVFLPEYRNETEGGCWEWTGRRDSYGYGTFIQNGKEVRVSRLVLESIRGPLGNLEACHTCDNPPCFRPDHLFAGTHRNNMEDALSKGRLKPREGQSGERGVVWVKGRNRWRVLRYQLGRQVTYGEYEELSDALKRNAELRK